MKKYIFLIFNLLMLFSCQKPEPLKHTSNVVVVYKCCHYSNDTTYEFSVSNDIEDWFEGGFLDSLANLREDAFIWWQGEHDNQ